MCGFFVVAKIETLAQDLVKCLGMVTNALTQMVMRASVKIIEQTAKIAEQNKQQVLKQTQESMKQLQEELADVKALVNSTAIMVKRSENF